MPKARYHKAFPTRRSQSAADITKALARRDAGATPVIETTTPEPSGVVAASAAPSAPGPADQFESPSPSPSPATNAEGHQE